MTDAYDGPKYPDVEVQLSGEDGNVFSIIGRIAKALRRQVSRRTFDVATDDDAIAATEAYFARPAVRSAGNITVRVG